MKLPDPPEPYSFVGNVRMLTMDEVESYGRACADAALEAAARTTEQYCGAWSDDGTSIAAAIRALKEKA